MIRTIATYYIYCDHCCEYYGDGLEVYKFYTKRSAKSFAKKHGCVITNWKLKCSYCVENDREKN